MPAKKLFLILLLTALAPAASLLAQASLRPGDVIEIRISGVPLEEIQQFNAPYTIDDAGMINLPYIGMVKASGLLPNQVQAFIENKLKTEEIYSHPTIAVQPPVGQRFVSVGGSVRAPGRIQYSSDLTLMSAINAAGSFNDFADQKRVRLVHEGKAQVYDCRKIRKDPSTDPKVFPGDQIEVPQSWY